MIVDEEVELNRRFNRNKLANVREAAVHKVAGEMMVATENRLRVFFQPYNQMLADVLEDECFLWRGSYRKPERYRAPPPRRMSYKSPHKA